MKAFIGWSMAISIGFTLVYCTYSENKENGDTWSREFRAVYESVGRPMWAACVAWVIAACHYGRGGIKNIFKFDDQTCISFTWLLHKGSLFLP